ncbi:MAG: secondary thiamine-phosphate synthase enzyme YjbQ [Candidatus Eremiobacteraeota bacterium]|nr:secondary thiamine-phosphate synthase enzyme YjbQ [Candidatus Eremiobacteraeota bacterium]
MEFSVKTSARSEFLCITDKMQKKVTESGIKDGICTAYIPHTTAAVTINEGADPDVVKDMIMELDRRIPWNDGYDHLEGNSAAHIKTSLIGPSVTIIIENGKLKLGTWQKVFFCEFDGPRTRKVWLKII